MAALVLCGLWALTLASSEEPAAGRASPTAPPAARDPAAAPGPVLVAAAPAPATPAQAPSPPGVSAGQWAAIEAEVGRRPDAPAELQRLRDYFAWSDALRRFRESGGSGAASEERLALARSLEQGLGERVRRAEVSAAEARQIEAAILAVTVPDDAERGERLRRWAAAELPPPAPADPRQAAFRSRQAEIVAAWSAQPAAARDRAALERELEALRQQSFPVAGGPR
jgi:hypothetical protein